MSERDSGSEAKALEAQIRLKDAQLNVFRERVKELLQELQKLQGRVDQLTHGMALLQKALVPTEIPHFPGVDISSKFQAGALNGGDYFDVFEHQDRMHLGLLLSSASSYSASALFLGALIQLIPDLQSQKFASMDLALARLKEEVLGYFGEEDRVSLCLGTLDRRSFEFSFVSCGEMMGFLLKDQASRLIKLEPSEEALSKHSNKNTLSQSVILNPRDRLILASPGILQAADPNSEAFGFERMQAACLKMRSEHLHELRNEILFQKQSFLGSAEPVRDQTLLILEVKDRVIKLAK